MDLGKNTHKKIMEQSYVMVQCLHIRNIQDLRRFKTYFELFKVRNDIEMLELPYSPHHRKGQQTRITSLKSFKTVLKKTK